MLMSSALRRRPSTLLLSCRLEAGLSPRPCLAPKRLTLVLDTDDAGKEAFLVQ